MHPIIAIEASDMQSLQSLIRSHISALTYPFDSWMEDCLFNSSLYTLRLDEYDAGYAAVCEGVLNFFYTGREYAASAPELLSRVIDELNIKRVQVMTQDAPLCALIAEWEYTKEISACQFTDVRTARNNGLMEAVFRTANTADIPEIRQISGGFFDESDNNFSSLEQRVEAGILFVLYEANKLVGCGIAEKSRLIPGVVSIGMFVAKEHRRRGAAIRILTELKSWATRQGLTPVAGCWYYNTLSRRSLEASGMAATGIVFNAVLGAREKLPLRTGNPPGELVE